MRYLLPCLFLLATASQSLANSLLLDATTKALEMETSAAVSTDYVVSYADHTSSAFTPGMNQGNVATATTTTILSAPAASTQRQVKWVHVKNRGTTANTVTLKLDVSATEYHIGPAVSLGAGESLRMDADGSLTVFTSAGLAKVLSQDTGYSGRSYGYQKTGTAKDAAGYWYAHAKDAGFPGAFALGTPGLNGFNTDCSIASQATNPVGATQVGAHQLVDAGTGSYYLTNATLSSSVAEHKQFIDVLWYDTGIAVTTTTGQTVTMPGALPARDGKGSTNGDGVYAALLTTTANTNAAVITTTTLTYTDSDGNANNTATFSAAVGWQAPATPVIGTWMPFQLQAGDRGIRSVQTITLGTSYGGGALSLILYRPIIDVPITLANIAFSNGLLPTPGIRVYNDTCIWQIEVGSASAATMAGSYTIMER